MKMFGYDVGFYQTGCCKCKSWINVKLRRRERSDSSALRDIVLKI